MEQDDRHEWFAEVAEDFVRYVAARDGLEVFAGGKWAADLAIHDRSTNRWCRVEVYATDRPDRQPRKKSSETHARIAEAVAEVTMPVYPRLELCFWKLDARGLKDPQSRIVDPAEGELRSWLNTAIDAPSVEAGEPLPEPDRLLQLSGTIDTEFTDVGRRHDEYLGQALVEELRGGVSG